MNVSGKTGQDESGIGTKVPVTKTICHDNLGQYDRKSLRGEGQGRAKTGDSGASAGNLLMEMQNYSVLFIHNEEEPTARIEAAIQSGLGGQIDWCRAEALFDGLRMLQERSFDLIISELFLTDGQGLATLRHLTQQAPKTPVLVLCHQQDRETAVNAVRRGARDFFCYEDPDVANLQRAAASAVRGDSPEDTAKAQGADRRTNARFPCRLAVSYQALEHPFLSGEAVSETLNISSKGLLFATNEPFQPGQLLQVSVDWPARLENSVPLKLVAEGRIVRNANGQAAMRIDKYEFRTRKVKTDADNHHVPTAQSEAGGQHLTRPGTAAGTKTNVARERRTV
jgi:DNA-binding NarL/FixJ family response regulator